MKTEVIQSKKQIVVDESISQYKNLTINQSLVNKH